MAILLKIAFRNIIANWKRSLLVGAAVFFSSLIMLIVYSVANGGEEQMIKGYVNLQSGNVAVVWEDLKKISSMNPRRLFDIFSFNIDKDRLNKTAMSFLNKYLKEHSGKIKYYFPTIRRGGTIETKTYVEGLLINSISAESGGLIINTGTLEMKEGAFLSDEDYRICISEFTAADKIKLGDMVTVSVTSPYGANNMLDFVVGGIYANSAGYNNYFGYITEENARELFDFDESYFDIGRIYLKNPDDSKKFAHDLDKYLMDNTGGILRAESSVEASAFYNNNAQSAKAINTGLILFLLIMIAAGLRATIKMNLFERMKEFGTIRAIGFSRMQSYSIIFFEIFFLSLIALAFAVVVSSVFILVFGKIGIYVGETLSYGFGGEVLYPKMIASDIVFTLIIMIIFSLVSTFSPGMKICFQKITDLLMKRQRKVYLTGILAKKIIK